MFYFDEDHRENGFDAPLASDNEEEHRVGEAPHKQNPRREEQTESRIKAQKPTDGSAQNSKEWQRAKNSGSTTTLSTESYGGGRCSSETTTGSSPRDFISGRFSDNPIEGEFDGLSDGESESEEQPAELVPLGMRTYSLSGCKSRYHKKARSHFADFYKLVDDHLGSGAYASVRTGISLATGKEFAIKLIDKHKAGHTRSRVIHEVETFNLCKNHPNIVQLHEWFEDHDRFYLVFEKMRGGPLLDHIQRKKFFTEQEASKVTKDIATALKFLHDRGIAHRDVKPENVLCSDIDRVSPVKLCDLDLASKASPPSSPRLTNVNSEPDLASPVGSAEFMAPEVVDAFVGDALKYDKRCDMWSLGVIVYIMICGYPPFYGECWRENCGWDQGLTCNDCQENLFKRIQQGQFDFPAPEWENVSEEAKDLICHLLVKNVRQRFTADEVLKHPWVKNGAPETKLQTPGNLFRNDSTRDVHQMQEHFNVMNRIVAARLSARMEQDQSIDGRAVLKRSPEYKIFEDITADKSPARSVYPKQPYNVVTTKVEATFREQSSSPNGSVPKTAKRNVEKQNNIKKLVIRKAPSYGHSVVQCAAPVMHFMNGVSNSGNQYPLHVSEIPLPSPLRYTDRVPLLQTPHVIPPPFHLPPGQIVNMNGMALYPRMLPQPIYPPQQMFHVVSSSYVPNANVRMAPYQATCGSNIFDKVDRRSKLQCNGIMTRTQQQQPMGGQVRRMMVTVRSAANLSGSSCCDNHPPEHLETCQGAMVKQDSKTDLRQCQARETQVNV
ncbi:Protein kinase domain containing protein [Brugia malayi]|uniref:BMA-MNK-1, isoform v n=1 Tax=Brugia malayi TaxID=6279 RepID=A0A1P6C4J6_BRUMA|nr:Protein kinase domain containing protein [Brugia malayi]CDP91723.1 BMA-MNK-1, isoform v [Brugia malayi]VIO93440.1 Protein kinase domain containing protein [Brugia malayi]